MSEGLQKSLRELAADGRSWAHVGTIETIEAHDSYGFLLNVLLQPSGLAVQARPVWMMGGAQGEGIYAPMAEGDEVVILCPDGDLNRALAWPGPPSGPSKPPAGWENDRISLIHAGGIEARTAEGASVEAVVVESLLSDLAGALTEVQTALLGLGLPCPNLTALLPNLSTLYRSAALKAEGAGS
jgi:hypothetical protein